MMNNSTRGAIACVASFVISGTAPQQRLPSIDLIERPAFPLAAHVESADMREAILLHGEDAPPPPGSAGRSEAQEARDAFKAKSAADQAASSRF